MLSIFVVGSVNLVQADAFVDASKQMDKAFNLQDQLFEHEKISMDEAYKIHEAHIKSNWNSYANKIESKWGKENSKLPTKNKWVSYSEDRNQRNSIDFKAGNIQVEVQVPISGKENTTLIKSRLKAQLEKVFLETPLEDNVLKVVPQSGKTSLNMPSQSPLTGQMAFPNGQIVTPSNVGQFADEMVQQKLTVNVIQTPQGAKKVYSLSINMIPDHIKKRAEPYLNTVRAMSQKYNIPVALIYGIMQTESYFNPMARSHVPAFGLMQLVPRSGGRDAYEYAFKVDKIVSGDFLYNARNNIELGSAYLKLLQVREMRRIKDPSIRMLCVIAAYNTGGGNVAKAFIPGSRNIKAASAVINTLTFNQVYHQLRTNLPYKETRDYVKRVWERMGHYDAWNY